MLDKKIVSQVLQEALKTGGDFAEVFEERTTSNRYNMLNGQVDDTTSTLVCGVGLRVYHGLESVYAHTNDSSEASLLETAKTLAAAIHDTPKEIAFTLVEKEYENRHKVSKLPSQYGADVKLAILKKANDAAFAYDESVKKVQSNYWEEEQHVAIANSHGLYIQDTRVRTRISCNVIVEDGDKMQNGRKAPGASKGLEFYDELDVAEMAREAARIAKTMLYADECPSGVMPVVIANGFGGVIFHEACGHSLEAAAVAKNQSVFSGKMGQKIASECVNAIDDGTIPNAWGSCNIDDEGTFSKRNVLIENGILKSYLVDTLNGKRMGLPSTGSSRRESYKYEEVSRMNNTYIDNGSSTVEEIIAATPYGLYAKNLGGGSVEPSTGDFNFAVLEGYIIKDGKIDKPVKGATLIGNGAQTLLHIDMVANNLSFEQGLCGASSGSIPTDVGQPTIRVSEMIVGGKEGASNHE